MRLCFFTVTEEDLRVGKPKDLSECAAARAFKRAAGDAWPEADSAYLLRSRTPERLREYINKIDRGGRVGPETFIVDLDAVSFGDCPWSTREIRYVRKKALYGHS